MTGTKARAVAGAALVALAALTGCGPGKAAHQGRVTPSGLPVPRYVSLKFDEVNARGGPGDDYKLLWVYRAKGLPVQVVAEADDWRRVCDPYAGLAWVKSTGVDGRRTVARLDVAPLPLRAGPSASAKVEAILAGHSVAGFDRIHGGWVRLKAPGGAGWAPVSAVWGLDEHQQCR